MSAALGSRTIPRHVRAQRIEIDKDGATETVTYTETAQVDCPTCAGSGQGVDFDGRSVPTELEHAEADQYQVS